MICSECLEKYIQMLTVHENTFMIFQQAFAEIGAMYHIGRVTCNFRVESTVYTVGGSQWEGDLFQRDGEVKEEPDYSRSFVTGERGNVTYGVYRMSGEPAFTEEERRDLEIIIHILFTSSGRWRLINQVKKVSLTDSLTGLVNAGGFLNYVDELIKKNELIKYNAYYLNLERFSLVNKRFGMKETDTIIVRYVEAMRSFLTEGECMGRLGGDNFVALIKKEHTEEFLNFLRGVPVYGMLGERKVPVSIGAKAGGLVIDESVSDCGSVINDCAMALTVARRAAGKPVVFVSDTIKEKTMRERQMAFRFGTAVQNGEFLVYYQPKVRLKDYSLAGAEALTRWNHQGIMISPAEFIPVFEKNGMICALDFYVLEQVCRDIVKWKEKGLRPLRVSVNFSRMHLSNPNLAEDIVAVLDRYGVERERIEIELTETVDAEETGCLVSFVKKMKEYRVAISIDDFGTGYSSLNLLRSFPADVLKIDKSFIDELGEKDRIVLSNITRMASELKMDVIAEGVENRRQLEYLSSIDCGMVQGFLFDKPMPEETFEDRIKTWRYQPPEYE
ncbi:MAG: putative bifunctional diguanylate cyclase/phosphodiesterase [Lachnospiraceae bacterium]